jgi:hypothetical protein
MLEKFIKREKQFRIDLNSIKKGLKPTKKELPIQIKLIIICRDPIGLRYMDH